MHAGYLRLTENTAYLTSEIEHLNKENDWLRTRCEQLQAELDKTRKDDVYMERRKAKRY